MNPIDRLNEALQGSYRIEREVGEGGMATVYLASDLKHERRVALKVLKPELAALVGAERFLAEIKTTANLQHPHILPLFDSGQADGLVFYVMPFVEGESLRRRLDREVQLPVAEAVRIATAVANAVGYAHRQGIIHRDIKPENVLLHEGEPLVADFGIALAVTAAGGSRMTETGLSLGTPFYMSPEQASADRELGPQSDVYSVGCMLHEMLVGEPPHSGKTAQAVLAKILTERPRSITELRGTVPRHIAAAVSRALERLPADRFESAEDFVAALGDPGFTHEVSRIGAAPHSAVTADGSSRDGRSPLAKFLPWGVAAAALAVAAWSLIPEPAPAPQPTLRLALSDFVVQGLGVPFAISRDGSTIVAGGEDGRLHVRRSDDTEFRPIPGTEGGASPAMSPDGEWVAFVRGGELLKVQLGGGPVLPIADGAFVAHWFSQEEIVYSASQGLMIVSSAGGAPRAIETGGVVFSPFMLPGGRGLIGHDGTGLFVVDLSSGERTVIAEGGTNGLYLPTGHIIYGDPLLQSALAVPFDLSSLRVTGDPVPVLPSVRVRNNTGATLLAVSDNGTLVQVLSPGGGGAGELGFTWIDLAGTRTELPLEEVQPTAPRISRDGSRIAYQDDASDQLWTYDLQTGERTRVTDGGATFPTAAWSPDGTRLLYSVLDGVGSRWMSTAADGSGASEEIIAQAAGRVNTLSPDGRWLIGEGTGVATSPDIVYADLDAAEVQLRTYLRADWHEEDGEVSPDGRWLAYQANEGGTHGVYIRSFPEAGPVVRLSDSNGGPVWSPDGEAVFYVRGFALVKREVRLGDAVELGEETELFQVPDIRTSTQYRNYDIHPDGDRFLFMTSRHFQGEPVESIPGVGKVVVVAHWFDELKRRMGEGP